MHSAQVLAYENDGKLTERLRPLSKERGFWLRQVRQHAACLQVLGRDAPDVLVLKLGRDLEREMSVLEQAGRLFPDTACIVVGDSDFPGLESLAWDLGARFVLFPPQPLDMLPELVAHMLGAAK
jgi:hypothetical protein